MIFSLLGIVNALIFAALATLHFYWAFGGKKWLEQSLPTNPAGKKMLLPGILACLVVAVGLLAFSFYCLVKVGLLPVQLPAWLHKWGIWILAGIFLLRAVGDFKFVGFFKSVKATPFAVGDTKYYSPLCLWLALTSFAIAFR